MMEDMARLALVEESVRNNDQFRKILHELLRHFNHILENPHDFQLRTIKSNILKEVSKFESFCDYLKYIGFEVTSDNFIYPHKSALSNLRIALAAIERKINFCFGSIDNNLTKVKAAPTQAVAKINSLKANILTTSNPFLLKIQELFNNMLTYEDPELQALAREQIPIVTLQLLALDRVREQQMQLKTGKLKGHDLPFDIALLMELLAWFKYKFFSWVDKPECALCGGTTVFIGTTSMTTPVETCRVELYRCTSCPGTARFPRHNDVRTLLRTRRGRCGEWANCFTLLCRALGYDTRYVYDTTDHVWCEVFDFDSNTWLHADPCEGRLDAPLLYCHGWGKRLSYVLALARDDLQDVTWRYTMQHGEVLKRRKECTESELIDTILVLREHRQKSVSEARRLYLAKRTAQELVQLMQERSPTDLECDGRVSGSAQWRGGRGEGGVGGAGGHTFHLAQPATYVIRYYTDLDKYRISCDKEELESISTWNAGAYEAKNMFRKVEKDWGMVYLARREGTPTGSISWRVSCGAALRGACLRVRPGVAEYESARVRWSVAFDDLPPAPADQIGESPATYVVKFSSATVTAELSGGAGSEAWQHAQLFRQPLHATATAATATAATAATATAALEILVTVEKDL